MLWNVSVSRQQNVKGFIITRIYPWKSNQSYKQCIILTNIIYVIITSIWQGWQGWRCVNASTINHHHYHHAAPTHKFRNAMTLQPIKVQARNIFSFLNLFIFVCLRPSCKQTLVIDFCTVDSKVICQTNCSD